MSKFSLRDVGSERLDRCRNMSKLVGRLILVRAISTSV